MYAIISCTNRPNSNSLIIANLYKKFLEVQEENAIVLSLEELPEDFMFTALYEKAGQNELFNQIMLRLKGIDKFIFIIPEYNGSFPGILKAFIDGMKYPSIFRGKKSTLTGISAGMSGGTLALSHFTDILNYLGMNVMAKKVKIPYVEQLLREDNLEGSIYEKFIKDQIIEFHNF